MPAVTQPRTKPPRRRAANVVYLSRSCAEGNHNRCTGRVYSTGREPGEPRFRACECRSRACTHSHVAPVVAVAVPKPGVRKSA